MTEPTQRLVAAVAATGPPHALPGRPAPSEPGALSRLIPDTCLGVPAVVDHGLRQARKPPHYYQIVSPYHQPAPCRGGRW
jgi:hypothetical protein